MSDTAHAAGVVFIAPDNSVLLLLRSPGEKNYANHWALPGGGGEPSETPMQTALREVGEEIGDGTRHAWVGEPTLLDEVPTPTGLTFSTFVQPARYRFVPELNDEHSGYAWVMADSLPTPMHPQVMRVLGKLFATDLAGDDASGKLNEKERAEAGKNHSEREEMPASAFLEPEQRKYPVKDKQGGDWVYSLDLLLAAAREARMHGHEDIAKRADAIRNREFAQDAIAMDRGSVRKIDGDGHLHIEMTHISKANVCPYYGREIPDFETLRLDPDRTYHLYRDPAELAKAAPTFAGKPLLMTHIPVSADDHPREVTVGSLGDEPVFSAPYLDAPLTVWDGEAIDGIDTGKQRELSSAYRYRADMTPGTSPDGEPYDGVMRDIVGNHVALVRQGRAGPDVVVGDEAQKKGRAEPIGDSKQEISMSKTTKLSLMAATAHGALLTYLKPKLAQDAKVDLTPVLAGVTSKNFNAKRPSIVAGLKTATTGMLAQDADLEDVVGLLDSLEDVKPAEDALEPSSGMPSAGKPRGYDSVKEFLKDKLSAEDMKACDEMMDDDQEAMDEAEEERKAKDMKAKDEESEKVGKKAMDAAIETRVKQAQDEMRQTQRDIREAEDLVRPYLGKLPLAHDSATDVLRTALTALGVKNADKLHPDALKDVLLAQPLPRAGQPAPVAMDAAGTSAFFERFPEAKAHRVQTL